MVNPSDMSDLVKVAQKMQDSFKRVQEELETAHYEGVSGAGMVRISQNGRHYVPEMDGVMITQEAYNLGPTKLGDLIAAAFNAGTKLVESSSQQKMMGLSKELGLPEKDKE
ncbi:MAG: YbaB/EbfC family nucleoid-associated protein [Gammaproteobacteria bacterium]|nr:YbaB/EbfC family nucleoid-associated protein [Gammaproteobacteria bacterium]